MPSKRNPRARAEGRKRAVSPAPHEEKQPAGGLGGAAPPGRRVLAFALLSGACLLLAIGYIAFASQRTQTETAQRAAADVSADPAVLADVVAKPHVVFLHSPGGDQYRRVAVAPLEGQEPPRFLTPLQCQRLYVAAAQGLCLGNNYTSGIVSAYNAYTFDTSFQPGRTLQVAGIPSRVRVAPDGSFGSATAFVSGHSYADGGFSTQTTIIDVGTGASVGDLETFTVLRDGAKMESPDFNFWGVTFTRDSNRFYATLGSGGKTYLVEGDVAARQVRVLRENVECPSLSPDGTRLIFKKRVGTDTSRLWQLHLMDLTTMHDWPMPGETHSVDDQVEWFDDNRVLYALPDEGPPATIATNIWIAPVDGSDPPRIFLRQASSPAVVR
jgi:hypothetical protein